MVSHGEHKEGTGGTGEPIEYYEIGEIQLNCAIEMYNKNNFICAITLAGASEEILGKLLKEYSGEDNSLTIINEDLKNKYPELNSENWNHNLVRNSMKHVCEEICNQDLNIRKYALDIIARGIHNYFLYTHKLTRSMMFFYKENLEILT